MKKIMKNTNKSLLFAIFFVFALILSLSIGIKTNAYDGGYYGSYYDSGYGSYYDSGYGSYYDSGYGSYYDSGYGSYYDSGYGSYYGGYNDYCYDCVPYYDNYCYDCVPYHDDYCYDCVPITPINLNVSCSPSRYDSHTGDSITWIANISGGSGSVSYSWSGTDGLSGSGSQITKTYNNAGSKNAHVTVTSGGKTASADCGTVYVEEDQNDLTGSCYVSDSNVDIDESVTWTADASGGTGSYTYEWSGSSPLSGKTGRRVDVDYNSRGSKTGTVTIRSGNRSITRSCGTVYVEEDEEDLDVSCTVNDTNVSIGQTVRFDVDADGGDGSYRYYWSGTDGVHGNNSSLSKSWDTVGAKYVTIRVTSDGQSESVTCPTVVVGGLKYAPPAAPASLSAVYLNQVPYTGVEDDPKFWAFIIGLFMFSALAAYMIVKNKAKTERKNKILDFKNENLARKGIK